MKVITFNIRCADDKNGHSVDERAPRLKEILKKYDADIIGFQEVTPKWLDIINGDYAKDYIVFNKFRSKDKWSEASTILWKKDKFSLLDKGYFWFSKTPWVESMGDDYLYHCKRICQWVNLRENESGKEFYYFNLHFGFGDDYQVESVRQIKETVDALECNNAIITGDFNMTPDSAGYREAVKHFTDVNTLTANYKGATWHNYGEGEGNHIDYCFLSAKELKPKSYVLIDDLIGGRYPSDHYGIMAEF